MVTYLIADGCAEDIISVSLRSKAFKSSQATCSSDILVSLHCQLINFKLSIWKFGFLNVNFSFYWQLFFFSVIVESMRNASYEQIYSKNAKNWRQISKTSWDNIVPYRSPKARKSRKTDDVAAKARKSKKEEFLLTTFVQSVSLLGIAFHTSPYRTFNGQR